MVLVLVVFFRVLVARVDAKGGRRRKQQQAGKRRT